MNKIGLNRIHQQFSLRQCVNTSKEDPIDPAVRVSNMKELATAVAALGDRVLGFEFPSNNGKEVEISCLVQILDACPNLTKIDFSRSSVNDAQVEEICSKLKTTHVADVSFQYNSLITKACLNHFSNLPNIRLVDVQKCPRIRSEEAVALMEKRPDVKVLSEGFLGYEYA